MRISFVTVEEVFKKTEYQRVRRRAVCSCAEGQVISCPSVDFVCK
jgi:hypothetical protein